MRGLLIMFNFFLFYISFAWFAYHL